GARVKLRDSDFASLEQSYIDRSMAEAAGIFRVDSFKGAEIVGKPNSSYSDYSGLVFPYRLPESTDVREYRLRRDNPDLERQNGSGSLKEKGKYLSPPGAGNMGDLVGHDADREEIPAYLDRLEQEAGEDK